MQKFWSDGAPPLIYTDNLYTDVNEYAIDWGAPWPGHISLCDFVCVSDSLQDSAPQQYVRAATTARGRCDCHEMPDPGPAWWRHGGLVEGNTGRVCWYGLP